MHPALCALDTPPPLPPPKKSQTTGWIGPVELLDLAHGSPQGSTNLATGGGVSVLNLFILKVTLADCQLLLLFLNMEK